MQIQIGFEIKLHFPVPTTMIGLLHAYPDRYQMIKPEKLCVDPLTSYELFNDDFGNLCMRLLAPAGMLTLQNKAIVEVEPDLDWMDNEAKALPQIALPPDTLKFLYPSRYCEVDRLQNFAWEQFGRIPPGYPRVRAVCDWVYHHIEFGYAYACNTRTAYDAFQEGKGVCRDFTHLAIALCRSLGMPARYVTGYLGDIGVPKDPSPMDFSAWFEVFLSNGWYTFDPRHNERRIGRIVIAYGRDAADVAITTTFGSHKLEHFSVCTEEIKKFPNPPLPVDSMQKPSARLPEYRDRS